MRIRSTTNIRSSYPQTRSEQPLSEARGSIIAENIAGAAVTISAVPFFMSS